MAGASAGASDAPCAAEPRGKERVGNGRRGVRVEQRPGLSKRQEFDEDARPGRVVLGLASELA